MWEAPAFFAHDAETWQPVGPSPIANAGLGLPRELTAAEVEEVPGQFAAAAGRAAQAGFRAVEIHAAHGYLIHQFLSPVSNRRTDRYGGSLENRARLLVDVARAVRAAVGPEVAVLARLSATDWIKGGWTLEDTVQAVRWAAEAGVDHFALSSGGLDNPAIPHGPGYQVPFAEAVRWEAKASVNAVGLITDPAQAAQILLTGQADAVMAGRAWMRNPHLGAAWAAALGADLDGVVAPPYAMAHWGKQG
jgi:2,4-dienoyl-CoA reductase-like NADH-dependent reductase (Old Yellow Enzyme family)